MAKTKTKGNGEGTVYNNGKYWVGQITIGRNPETGKLIRKTYYGKTKKEVNEKITQTKYEINNEMYIEPSNMNLSEWAYYWLDTFRKPEIADTTYERYKWIINNRIAPPFKTVKLKDVNTILLQNYFNALQQEQLSDNYIAAIYKRLNGMLKKAEDLEIIRKNPITGVVLPKSNRKKNIHIFTKEEQSIFVEYCKNHPKYGNIFIFLLGTGMRIGEALALTWDDINLKTGIIEINKTIVVVDNKVMLHDRAKTPSGTRIVPINYTIKTILENIKNLQDTDLNILNIVFPSNTYEYINAGNSLRHSIGLYCVRAGVPKLNIHALRHTFATRAIEKDINIKVLSELLGHKDIRITLNTYAHALAEFKKENISKIDVFS